MLVLPQRDSIRLITQSDHARLARQLLSLWVANGFPRHPLREEILLATAEHDCGWQTVDSAPLLDRENLIPVDFRRYPDDQRQLLWLEAIHRLTDRDLSVALLVLRHAERIHRDRREREGWQEFFSALSEKRQELELVSETNPEELDDAYGYLSLADTASLGACGALGEQTLIWREYTLTLSAGRVLLEPFPYAGPSTLRVACRSLPRTRYSTSGELARDLTRARWGYMPVRVEAATKP